MVSSPSLVKDNPRCEVVQQFAESRRWVAYREGYKSAPSQRQAMATVTHAAELSTKMATLSPGAAPRSHLCCERHQFAAAEASRTSHCPRCDQR